MEITPDRRFWKLPPAVAGSRRLTPTAKVVYAFLLDCGRRQMNPAPGARKIAEACGVEESTAIAALKRLQREGLIAVTGRGRRRSVLYEVLGPFSASTPIIGVESTMIIGVDPTPITGVESTPGTGVESTMIIGVDPLLRDRSRERESADGLSLAAHAFQERMRKDHGVRVSAKQLWPLNPAFVAGVPVAFAVAVAAERWHVEPPWKLADRLRREWSVLWAAFRQAGRHRQGLESKRPEEAVLVRAAPYLTQAQILWARGEGPHAGEPEPPG